MEEARKVIFLDKLLDPDLLATDIVTASLGLTCDVEVYFQTPKLWDEYVRPHFFKSSSDVELPAPGSVACTVESFVRLAAHKTIRSVYKSPVVQFLFSGNGHVEHSRPDHEFYLE